MQTADAGGYDYAYAVVVDAFAVKAGILDGLTRSYKRILCIEIELALFLAVKVVGGIVALDFAGKLGLELRRIEMGNGACAAHTLFCIGPRGFHVIAKRGDGA